MTASKTSHHKPATQTPQNALDHMVHAKLATAAMGLSPISLALAYADWAMHLSVSPGKQLSLGQLAYKLGQEVCVRQINQQTQTLCCSEPDPRFAAPAWNQWPYRVWRDGYKASETWWKESTHINGMSRHHDQMVQFFARQWLDALSPSNWALTNPEVLHTFSDTHGDSVLAGVQQFMQDMKQLSLPVPAAEEPVKPLPFAVGKAVAVTPGKVVFKNHLIELIQYSPTTSTVHADPLLIVPSCIMKYYILDLSPHNSMVKYLVDQGFTVFMVSWRNPDSKDRDLGMNDYINLGVLEAIDAVTRLSHSARIHAMGYCLGGTFLSIAAAYLGREASHNPLVSLTLLAAQTDFSEPGELGVYIDDDQLLTLREEMARKGYLSGRQMAASFQFLNSRDLIWSRSTNRYLLGRDEVGNDMMSWNLDTTRLPARMHTEYLDSLFLNNALSEGHYRVNGKPVALMDIHQPLMVVGTSRDHISPWKSVYKIHLDTDTDTTFILAAGGHNAGIVSEPNHPHRSYQMTHMPKGHSWVDPDAWASDAATFEGSWWPAWSHWLASHSKGKVKARAIPSRQALYNAPGHHVMTRYAD